MASSRIDVASHQEAYNDATTGTAGQSERQHYQNSSECAAVDETDVGVLPGEMGELKRVQLAHEGMKLLLSSEVKAAEELFRASRFLGPELNAGYSFVQMLQAIMTFDEEAMDFAYKCLEGTEKFCDQHNRRFSNLFSSNSSNSTAVEKISEHEKLYRRTIIADCILFEAILVFLKQGITSYVKGGYLMRKAWKMYEKIQQDTEKLCTMPCPITKMGMASPMDKHVGRSMYDQFHDTGEGEGEGGEGGPIEEEEEMEDNERVSPNDDGVAEVGDSLAAMHVGLSMFGGGGGVEPVKLEFGNDSGDDDDEECRQLSQTDEKRKENAPGLVLVNEDEHPLSLGTTTTTKLRVEQKSAVPGRSASAAVFSTNKVQLGVDVAQKSLSQNNLVSKDQDETDGRGKGRKRGKQYRPQSGYFAPDMSSTDIQSLEHEDSRLRGAVYFGYGLMNIIMSLIPPKLMKLANLFGFHGNRRVGLQALEFASNSQDMKAPLARIGLLWYHTIIRPFFALDGEDEDAGTGEATRLLDEALAMYPSSALFLYFRGKVFYLQCQLPEALKVYSDAASLARDQREVEHIILYEKGWVHFLQLDYGQALPCYMRLKNETRWSACLYAYLAAVITGVQGDLKQSRELFLQTTKLVKRKNNNLEKFCSRRGAQYKKGETPLMALEAKLMAIEVIYLWRALPFCSEATKNTLLDMLNAALPPDAQPIHKAMTAWLKGGVLNSLGRVPEAEKSLHDALKYEQMIKYDKHILSFALYELAMIHISRDEYARARMMLNIAKEGYSGYEFEARLNFKVHSAMGLLR